MKLTKLQRYTLYCIMMAEVGEKFFMRAGICSLLKITTHSSSDNLSVQIEELPELIIQKPKKMYDIIYWFMPLDWTERKKILQKAIELTHPK